ncbi:class I SAM-dependent methyltransferase [Actinacidiphila paucisporea]|uniref:Methyltransferase domain-containing protein n=1 Tax=Actinacidiphila paucisporea TaxID=310782 RepID=A0A1M7NX84_9ACTN|nr:class I SAM-dependent methyltransferase [Actinacidiphila paucisporea]SHN08246.1 Methyltransferase domain-containing protein [Actinacidiphila paucisporea]
MESNQAQTELPEPTQARIEAAAESYRRPMLAAYDMFVLGMMSRFMWRCPRGRMLAHYDRQVGATHLDIGPGTGWFLDKCRFPVKSPSITLVDLNEVVLSTAAHRISRYRPEIRVGDAFKPFDLGTERFDSVGMNFLLHCLPGTMRQKSVVFDHVTPYLRPGARVFGSTVLGTGPHHTARSGKLLAKLNRSEVFSNLDDRLEDLDEQLRARFTDVETVRTGAVCLFAARHPGAR